MTATRHSIPVTGRADRRRPGARLRNALIAVAVTAGGLVPALGAAPAASASPPHSGPSRARAAGGSSGGRTGLRPERLHLYPEHAAEPDPGHRRLDRQP